MGKMKLEIEWNGMQKYKNKERKGIGDERRSVRGRRREDGAQGVERGGGSLDVPEPGEIRGGSLSPSEARSE